MQLINSTRMVTGFTIGREPSGKELLLVVVKGTFRLPSGDGPLLLDDQQVPLVMSDTFSGAPGRSAPRYEAEFVPRKRRCDVLVHGSAYAPEGRPTVRTQVGVRVGAWSKTFAVVGDRRWIADTSGIRSSKPVPFVQMPISYDVAFGGTDERSADFADHVSYPLNPVGRGFHRPIQPKWVDGTPLPNTEEGNRPVTRPDEPYAPMSLGPVGRHWEPRRGYAGTYDDRWLAEEFPFLPSDFSDEYYQAAPRDQQISIPQGGEDVALVNLTPTGPVSFTLPRFDAPVHFFPRRGSREDGVLTLDSIVIEPDHQRLCLTWRVARPLRRDLFEVGQTIVGKRSREWWAARESTVFPNRDWIRLRAVVEREAGTE